MQADTPDMEAAPVSDITFDGARFRVGPDSAGADPFRKFVGADRATDEQISLPIFYNPRRNAPNWGFNDGACSLM